MADNLYSTLIGWLKILLPLAALALLSTMFLFARGPATESAIPYAEIEEIARDARISGPRFAGMTEDGGRFEVTADRVTPEPDRPDALRIHDLFAVLTDQGGSTLTLSAGEGAFDGRARRIELAGLARLETSTGFAMETGQLLVDLTAGRVETQGAMEIRAPFGSLTAGGLVAETLDGGQRLHFTGGVRLLYDPQSRESLP